ncbi:MAG TPA: pyruvate:ferredoxin (flavodoxin) oxidoreductase, partial [Candidatus Limnocylindria bacterium]|nr:pyruvate:ferredoxin (flavodoxin) oxidoreductase [Candidatus Limnocylindria bacterium]
VAHAASIASRVPFMHFFDGFRTSHEVERIALLTDADLRALIDPDALAAFRRRRLTPEHPVIRGTAQDPDVFFQMREAASPFHAAVPGVVRQAMHALGKRTGRHYRFFDYEGAPDADRVIVVMGSAAGAASETVAELVRRGVKVGLVTVRLFRPFDAPSLLRTLPPTVRKIAVLDRTKEPGAVGEPLYQDVVAALAEPAGRSRFQEPPLVIGGRYGLASKEFTPAMALAVLNELRVPAPRQHFTVGIRDDVSGSSLEVQPFSTEAPDALRAVFYALGSDGTVGANHNTAKIVGERTLLFPQAYFVYDSRKAGSVTVSHLRFSPRSIRSSYLIERAGFVACHQWSLLERIDVLAVADQGAMVLLNSPYRAAEVWSRLPARFREQVRSKRLRLYVVDAAGVAREAGLGGRVNTVLQAGFFVLTSLLPLDVATDAMKDAARETYGKRGESIVAKNLAAIDAAVDAVHPVEVPAGDNEATVPIPADDGVPEFVRRVVAPMIARQGDALPVSAFPSDGTFPTGTARYEKRALALELPEWAPDLCIDCGKCAIVCPHAAIRMKAYPAGAVAAAPAGFLSKVPLGKDLAGSVLTVQVAPDDCTGCTLCVTACPATDKSDPTRKALCMVPADDVREAERPRWDFFRSLPDIAPERVRLDTIKGSQLMPPLFEFSGACSGCGETPYLKLLTQLYGDRLLVANATGCSSIFGGNLPTTPWSSNDEGRGPAWANSLFEDNAEFGLGMRIALDRERARAQRLLRSVGSAIGGEMRDALLAPAPKDVAGIRERRERVEILRASLAGIDDPRAREIADAAEAFLPKTVWIVGGDGWAYDIGFGGLDHVLASGRDVNVLVLDTEVYSNTGGQASKATPRGAVAKFAAAGKRTAKKDLGLFAMQYPDVYVAQIALGANDQQTVSALVEAERHPGPSLVIAYATCIAQGFDLSEGLAHQKDAVATGHWPLYRRDPSREGVPLRLDSKEPSKPISVLEAEETRFTTTTRRNGHLSELAQEDARQRWRRLKELATAPTPDGGSGR